MRVVLHGVREKLTHLHSSNLSYVSDVMLSLYLVQMHQVVYHPQVVVVMHFNVESLHGLRPGSALGNSAVDFELSLHELVVLSSDSVDNIWGMDVTGILVPVDFGHLGSSLAFSVEVIEDTAKLRVHVSGSVVVGGSSQTVQPLDGEVVVCNRGQKPGEKGTYWHSWQR